MTPRGGRITLVVLVATTSLALLPGAAQARTDKDPCPSAAKGVYNGGELVCSAVVSTTGGQHPNLGVFPFAAYENTDELPAAEIQCPRGTRIPGTGYWSSAFSYNWDWDYYVEGGDWVLWDGRIPFVSPDSGVISGGAEGYTAMTIQVVNWDVRGAPQTPIASRLFWHCEGAGKGRAAPRPKLGDGEDNALNGNDNDNALVGFAGDDRLRGQAGEDHLHGGAGNDWLHGGAHDDLIHGRRAADKAIGGNGDDDILLGTGSDLARGGKHDDQLFDDEGRDELRGGAGNDRFSARDGDRDVIRCGRGTDIAIIDAVDVATGCEFADLSARVTPRKPRRAEKGGVFVVCELEAQGRDCFGTPNDDQMSGTDDGERIHGLEGDDRIDAEGGDDELRGYDGQDVLHGGLGNDWFDGGPGDDSLTGTRGDDVISDPADGDADVVMAGAGDDKINVKDGDGRDKVSCGAATDKVTADPGDDVDPRCERT